MSTQWIMTESRAKLAKELLTLLSGDRREAERWAKVRARLDALDDFEQEETEFKKDKPPLPKAKKRLIVQGKKLPIAAQPKRDNKRFSSPVLQVIIGHQSYKTINWSLGGFLLQDYTGAAKIAQRIAITFCHAQMGPPYFLANTRVVRLDSRKNTLSLKLEILSESGFNFLSGLQLQQAQKMQKLQG